MKLMYFPLRGRAEVIKLICEHKSVAYEVEMPKDMKTDKVTYPFGQCPVLVDGDLIIAQSNTILRYLGRKLGMDGTTEADKVKVDMAVEAVESLRAKYVSLIYQDQLSDTAKATFYADYVDKASMDGRNGGAHIAYLDTLVKSGMVTSGDITIGDLCIWELTDLLLRLFPEQMKSQYPGLSAFYDSIATTPKIKDYLESDRRLAKINNNLLG